MTLIPLPTSQSFEEFSQEMTSPVLAERLARETELNVAELERRLVRAVAECAQTLRLLAGIDLHSGQRLLEVGAGMGLASGYLASCGFDVVAVEPGGVGFEENELVARQLASLVGWQHQVLPIGADGLEAERHGRFDVIFSNNVLEHVPDVAEAISSMWAVSTADGILVHSCPNYSVPFEPHFGIPLVPARPQWTEYVLPRSVRTSAVWRSLNFIRARDVLAISARLGGVVRFRPAALATSFERLSTDEDFRARHRLLGAVSAVLRRTGLTAAFRRLPATWSTPMDFALCRSDSNALLDAWSERQD